MPKLRTPSVWPSARQTRDVLFNSMSQQLRASRILQGMHRRIGARILRLQHTINGIGTTFYGSRDRCQTCGSVISSQWFCILFVPVFRLGQFRVKYVAPNRFISRKLLKKPKESENRRTNEMTQPPPLPPELTQPPPLPLAYCPQCEANIQAATIFVTPAALPFRKRQLHEF